MLVLNNDSHVAPRRQPHLHNPCVLNRGQCARNPFSIVSCWDAVAVFLGCYTSLRGEGLCIGNLVGTSLQAILLSVVTISTNYEKQ
ncbi:hypothetical protein Tco_0540078, partial [Tanacetum coccineum]